MSSHAISGSGQRQYTLSAGGGSMTRCQLDSRDEDRANVQLGGLGQIAAMISLSDQSTVRLQRWRSSHGYDVIVLVVDGSDTEFETAGGERHTGRSVVNVNVVGRPTGEFSDAQNMPHTNLDLRRGSGEAFEHMLGDGAELLDEQVIPVSAGE
jgi:hypothetical protein